ncbi:S-layer homology domain-containing protein [Salibacterium lacus]|uniref:S-layer homology domain-containing protein n=1 Tax=Salibacterium lacus TaxID=1898109 RepID=A0ABW5T5I9_9BACI
MNHRTKRRKPSSLLVRGAAVFLTAAGVGLAVPGNEAEAAFSDIGNDFWAQDSIRSLSEEGIIGGYPDGTFRPGEPITRIQAASMMAQALDLETSGRTAPDYDDIPEGYNRAGIVAAVSEEDVMSGSGDSFRPGEYINRAQMAAVIHRGFDLTEHSEPMFTDVDRSFWSFTDISSIAHHGIASGYADGTFRPGNETTRAQFSVFLNNALNPGESSSGGSVDNASVLRGKEVSRNGWTYTIRSGDLVRYTEGEQEKEVVLSNEDVSGDYMHGGGTWGLNDASGLTEGTTLTLKGDWLYYPIHHRTGTHSGNKNFHLYRVRTDGTDKQLILDEPADHYYIKNNDIYYVGYEKQLQKAEPVWKRARLDGTGRTSLVSRPLLQERHDYFDDHDNTKYALETNGSTVYYGTPVETFSMNLNGNGEERLLNLPARDLVFHENSLYAGSYRGFYKVRPDGSGHEKLLDEEVRDIAETGGSLLVLTNQNLYTYDPGTSELDLVKNLPVPASEYTRRDVGLERSTGDHALLYFVNSNGKDLFYQIQDGDVTASKTIDDRFGLNILAKERKNYYFTFTGSRPESSDEQTLYKAEGSTGQWKTLGTAADNLLHLYQDGTFIGLGQSSADEPSFTVMMDAAQQDAQKMELSLALASVHSFENLEKEGQNLQFELLGKENAGQQQNASYRVTFNLESGEVTGVEEIS